VKCLLVTSRGTKFILTISIRITVEGTRRSSCLRHHATSRKVAGSIPEGVIILPN